MSNGKTRAMTFGVIVGNRGFFPGHLAKSGRADMIAVLEKAGHTVVAPTPEDTKYGAVETRAEAAQCADLFKRHRETLDGVIVTLPNFGDERAIADTLRMAGLNVPVLVQATPDAPGLMTITDRRDSFCGKMSACNNLSQYGIPYSLTTRHTEAPDSDLFRKDLEWFGAVCRVVKGLKRLRIGAIGARPAAFNTVRYSERILETSGDRFLNMLQPDEFQLPTRLVGNVLEIATVPRRQHDALDAGALRSDDFLLHAADRKHEAAQTYLARHGRVVPDVPAGQQGR